MAKTIATMLIDALAQAGVKRIYGIVDVPVLLVISALAARWRAL